MFRHLHPMTILVKTFEIVNSQHPSIQNTAGRINSQALFSGLSAVPIMVMEPAKTPAAPMPPTALPTMSMVDEVAMPQRREPSSKKKKKPRNTHFKLNWVYNLPTRGWIAALFRGPSQWCIF